MHTTIVTLLSFLHQLFVQLIISKQGFYGEIILIFNYGMDEFLIYCNIYRFIPCNFWRTGKLSEKIFKEQQNVYTFRMSAISLAFGFLYT